MFVTIWIQLDSAPRTRIIRCCSPSARLLEWNGWSIRSSVRPRPSRLSSQGTRRTTRRRAASLPYWARLRPPCRSCLRSTWTTLLPSCSPRSPRCSTSARFGWNGGAGPRGFDPVLAGLCLAFALNVRPLTALAFRLEALSEVTFTLYSSPLFLPGVAPALHRDGLLSHVSQLPPRPDGARRRALLAAWREPASYLQSAWNRRGRRMIPSRPPFGLLGQNP